MVQQDKSTTANSHKGANHTMTVDEMTEKYMQYIGDDSDIALNCLSGKQEAKSHIRSIFV